MRDQQVNSFGGGMMKDLGTTIPQQGTYVDAKNIRVVSDASGQENNSGVVKNVKGNKKVLDFANQHDIQMYVSNVSQFNLSGGSVHCLTNELF